MGVDRSLAETMGLFVLDDGMDARIDGDVSTGRRYTKVESQPPAAGAVYIMSTVGGPFVKIGWVRQLKKVENRRELIQVGCPYRLQVVAAFEVESKRAETVLHKAFSDQHFRGEWFQREGRLLRFIHVAVAYPELTLDGVLEKSI